MRVCIYINKYILLFNSSDSEDLSFPPLSVTSVELLKLSNYFYFHLLTYSIIVKFFDLSCHRLKGNWILLPKRKLMSARKNICNLCKKENEESRDVT